MHLVIYFCGTGNPGDTFLNGYNYVKENVNVSTIFVKGCDDPEVCDATFFPDLKAFAQRFSKKLFRKEGDVLKLTTPDLSELKDLKIGVRASRSGLKGTDESIESITLCGYSRGAVSCFEVAKQLYAIAPNVPVDIVADQPVPGNVYHAPGTNAGSIADCSHLKNLRNVSVILGAYTGALASLVDVEQTSFFHRMLFSQIVPKLPRTATRDLIVIPRESHHEDRMNAPTGEEHMHLKLASYLAQKELVINGAVEDKIQIAKNMYHRNSRLGPCLFPQEKQLQGIFGLSKKEAYLSVDRLHPTYKLRKGMIWAGKQSLEEWWKVQDKTASYFSTDLTKHLVKTIKVTNVDNIESLKTLFVEADRWLLLKEGQMTSRYHQVEALRHNIFYCLMDKMHVPKQDLSIINRQNLAETNYFLKRWLEGSKAASYFKTAATIALDQAFETHAKSPYSEETDRQLLIALDCWLAEKKESNSRRFDLVLRMREHLEDVIRETHELQQDRDHDPSLSD